MVAVLTFFAIHWYGSVFMQSFFLHRYVSHRQFRLSLFWERFFMVLTYILQGSSYLHPKGYGYLHRLHHAHSDTEKDPHSPHYSKNLFSMMWQTKLQYDNLRSGVVVPEPGLLGGIPEWPAFERLVGNRISTVLWMLAYTAFYIVFADAWWQFLLLPIHFITGPTQGAIVNWAGHKYGYRNFETNDKSRNSLVADVLTVGELFQNNHHRHPMRMNFGWKKFEFDPVYPAIRLLMLIGVVKPLQEKVPVTA